MPKSKNRAHTKWICVLGIGAAAFVVVIGIYVLFPQWIPDCLKWSQDVYRTATSTKLISIVSDQETVQTPINSVRFDELTAAMENNHHDNFQTCFQAEAAYVVDEEGKVLYAKNEHTRLYPASTTKLLTAYIAIMNTENLDALITVDELSGCYESGSLLLYLEQGDQISMRDLLYALLMCSYNDAATAIAMEVAGSLDDFSVLMNQQLEEFGAVNSHYLTPHGLHAEEHYTTAYDLNLILQKVYGVDLIREILMTEKTTIEILNGEDKYVYEIQNGSFFLRNAYSVPTMKYLGGKTGYTQKARSCLASVFELNGVKYYSTIMKSEDASYMTTILLDYYFAPEALSSFSATIPLMRD